MKRLIAMLCLITALGILAQGQAMLQLSGSQGRAILEDLNVSENQSLNATNTTNTTNSSAPANVTNATAPARAPNAETGSGSSSLWSWGSDGPRVKWPGSEEETVIDEEPYYGEPANGKTVTDILPVP